MQFYALREGVACADAILSFELRAYAKACVRVYHMSKGHVSKHFLLFDFFLVYRCQVPILRPQPPGGCFGP